MTAIPRRIRSAVRAAKRFALGLCVWCGEPAVTKRHCEKHRLIHNERVRNRRKRRLDRECEEPLEREPLPSASEMPQEKVPCDREPLDHAKEAYLALSPEERGAFVDWMTTQTGDSEKSSKPKGG